ncbi:MAG: methionyl-tRNA formyltransferase [Pseudohongiellaceae bacterium]
MSATPLRLVFAGTPAFAADHLQGLIDAGHQVVGVFSQPDRPSGRGKKILPTPVKTVALAQGIPVFQPASLDDSACSELTALAPDLLIVVAYGLLLSPRVLALPALGCINVHASLLPRWRGAAPIERAILAGDAETGVTIMQMDAGLDTGDMLLKLTTPIGPLDNAASLTDRLIALGIQGLNTVLANPEEYQAHVVPQLADLATYAAKLDKSESEINWFVSAVNTHNQIQAFNPRSPAWCPFEGDRLRILEAVPASARSTGSPGEIIAVTPDSLSVACGEGALSISMIQLPGKKPMTIRDVLNGRPDLFREGQLLST